mgnify:CR=1 FL=1
MHFLVGIGLLLLILLFGVQGWTRKTLKEHAANRTDLPGAGGEFAQQLLSQHKLSHITVKSVPEWQDHYDSRNKSIGLSDANLTGRSLTALVVAAHEVGHAIQDKENYKPLRARQVLHQKGKKIEYAGSVILLTGGMVVSFLQNPLLLKGLALLVVPCMAFRVVTSLMSLPLELDASFKRALPFLRDHLDRSDMVKARKILTACAFTYVANAASNLFNLWRWVALLFVRRLRF